MNLGGAEQFITVLFIWRVFIVAYVPILGALVFNFFRSQERRILKQIRVLEFLILLADGPRYVLSDYQNLEDLFCRFASSHDRISSKYLQGIDIAIRGELLLLDMPVVQGNSPAICPVSQCYRTR